VGVFWSGALRRPKKRPHFFLASLNVRWPWGEGGVPQHAGWGGAPWPNLLADWLLADPPSPHPIPFSLSKSLLPTPTFGSLSVCHKNHQKNQKYNFAAGHLFLVLPLPREGGELLRKDQAQAILKGEPLSREGGIADWISHSLSPSPSPSLSLPISLSLSFSLFRFGPKSPPPNLETRHAHKSPFLWSACADERMASLRHNSVQASFDALRGGRVWPTPTQLGSGVTHSG